MKIFKGKIVSTGMTNTVVVEVLRVTPHPLYRKLVRSTKKYKVDTNGISDLIIGASVEITETKPMSKDKYFKITRVAGAAKAVKGEASKKEKEVEIADVKSEAKVETKSKAKAKKTAVKGSK